MIIIGIIQNLVCSPQLTLQLFSAGFTSKYMEYYIILWYFNFIKEIVFWYFSRFNKYGHDSDPGQYFLHLVQALLCASCNIATQLNVACIYFINEANANTSALHEKFHYF